MTEPSPPGTSDGSASLSPPDILGRAPIKRARPQLSCTPCRQGKLKCNREHPICDQCSKRSRHDACHYVPPPARNKQAQNMRGRIRNLESLVVNLINQKSQESGTPVKDIVTGAPNGDTRPDKDPDEADVESFGQLRISHAGEQTQTSYVGAGHWSSLLKEIEEVKEGLDDDDEAAEEAQEEEWDHFNARSTVTFGVPRPISKTQLIQEMPSKEEVDRLLPLWFNSSDPLLYIIHAPTFQDEYKQFWKDPHSMPVMWIALLYSALALGIILGPRNPGMTNPHPTSYHRESGSLFDKSDQLSNAVNRFQQLASSAMVLADIAKSQPYTLETLMIYGECEFLRRDDHHSKIWLMNGVTLRVAMRMGYHRDPSNFSGISVFQGEMRRRVWHVLNMMDTLISFAIGLPTLIRRVESDVRAPHNVYDHDISPAMTHIPKERPTTEITPGLYTIAKSRVAAVFGEAAELSQKVTPPRHSTIMALNKRLEEAHDLIPEGMRVRPMDDCITDSPVLVMSRFNIELLYHKTRIVLHRAFLTAGQTDARFAESRNICVKAAMEILDYQNIIVQACSPGGQLNKVWWYMSSLTAYDFLLAAMILCLELNHFKTKGLTSPKAPEMFGLLENTLGIWTNFPNRFRESAKGAEMLKAMLRKCSVVASSHPSTVTPPSSTSFGEGQSGSTLLNLTPETLSDELPPQIWGTWPPVDPSSFDMADIPSEIDWTFFDSTLQGQSNILPQTTNTSMDSWMVGSMGIDNSIGGGELDFGNPLNLYNTSSYIPPPIENSNNIWPPQ
ncbi:hypothetical protein EJ04DRAFT_2556 [Polyplosphaeria fusca]|uniref:Zn(2)-C6 fungal-type domain-containing protein n=1 Tax=Polyplosphaeria fusca TaxID=682080 RepID=A0A9P4RC13_9PLEO|nr:hypothetical protein EJ04DRAFT_2556 [Polyplosphaeria fusca]